MRPFGRSGSGLTGTEQQRVEARLALAAKGAWGVCLTGEELTAAGAANGWTLTDPIIGAFNDRAAWRARPASTAEALLSVLYGAFTVDAAALGRWLERAVDAGHQAIPELRVSLISQTLLLMALGVHQEAEQRVPDKFVQALVRAIRALPLQYRTLGYDPILGAIDALLMHFEGESDQLRFAVFRAASRRLPALEHFRAVQTFVNFV